MMKIMQSKKLYGLPLYITLVIYLAAKAKGMLSFKNADPEGTKLKSKGGLGILNLETWNKAALGKILWDISNSKEKLWVQWVHHFYVKGRNFWDVDTPKQASWMLRQVFKLRPELRQAIQQTTRYQIGKVYKAITIEGSRVGWDDVIWFHRSIPKHNFTLWLAIRGRLPDSVRLQKIGLIGTERCALCGGNEDNQDHLFFECVFTQEVIKPLGEWMGISISWRNMTQAVRWVKRWKKSKDYFGKLRIVFAACVYNIWRERNARIFGANRQEATELAKITIEMVKVRASKGNDNIAMFVNSCHDPAA